jgi:hypothetical protein
MNRNVDFEDSKVLLNRVIMAGGKATFIQFELQNDHFESAFQSSNSAIDTRSNKSNRH